MTNDGLVAFNQASGLAGYAARSRPRRLASGPDRRRQDLHLPAAAEHPLLERPAGQGVRCPLRRSSATSDRSSSRCRTTTTASSGRTAASSARSTATSRAESSRMTPRGTVTFHLSAPDPEFLYKLALPFAYVRAARTRRSPARSGRRPAAGDRAVHDRELPAEARRSALVRNPYFHEWSKAAQPDGYPDEIVFRIGGTPDDAVTGGARAARPTSSAPSQSETPPSEGATGRAQDSAREPGAHEPAAGDGRSLPQHSASALRPARRSACAQLRRRSRGGRLGIRRVRRRPVRPARFCLRTSRATGLLPYTPVHTGKGGAGSRKGARPRRALGHARHEGHVLFMGGSSRASARSPQSCFGRSGIGFR